MAKITLQWGSVFVQASFQHVSVHGVLISVISKDDKDTKSPCAFQKITSAPVRIVVHILWFLEGYVQETTFVICFFSVPLHRQPSPAPSNVEV